MTASCAHGPASSGVWRHGGVWGTAPRLQRTRLQIDCVGTRIPPVFTGRFHWLSKTCGVTAQRGGIRDDPRPGAIQARESNVNSIAARKDNFPPARACRPRNHRRTLGCTDHNLRFDPMDRALGCGAVFWNDQYGVGISIGSEACANLSQSSGSLL